MSIKWKLTIAILVTALLGAAAVAGVLVARDRVLTSEDQLREAEELSTQMLVLNVLRTEYLLHRSARARAQWEAQLEHTTELLSSLTAVNPEEVQIVKELQVTHLQRLDLVARLLEVHDAQAAGRLPVEAAQRTEDRLIGQLTVQFQVAVDAVSRLSENASARLHNAMKLSTWFTVASIAVIVLMVGLIALLVWATVLASVKRLSAGVEAVAAGDLSYRIGEMRHDELGDLGRGFDEMTSELEQTTAELREHQETLEDLVAERTEDLRKANEELDRYARGVSHDLRAPLAAVSLANELLRDAAAEDDIAVLKEDIEQQTASIDRSTRRAHDLVKGLLELAESGQVPTDVNDVPVSEVLQEILLERSSEIQKRGVVVLHDDELGTVRANRLQIYQLFSNLVSNAILHNESSAPVVEVRYLGEENGMHSYLVKDNGPALDESVLEKMFQPFFKAGRRSDTGIGLAMTRKIVEVYGGTITAYNDNGVNFSFTISDWPPPQ